MSTVKRIYKAYPKNGLIGLIEANLTLGLDNSRYFPLLSPSVYLD